jgi:DNA repair and recombination RAD54-like protein
LSDHFIIRRMNRLNAEHLPPKLTQVVCCKLTPTQQRMYEHVVRKRDRVAATQGHVKDTLGVIQRLQKICNHPSLATQVDASASRVQRDDARELESLMPENDFAASAPRGRGGRIDHRYARMVDPALSGKLRVLHALMSELRRKGRERIVVVSVYMTTLDLIEQMCNQEDWPSCKLGGSTSTKKRKQFNDEFNDPTANYFAFLLSSKAGGCGLNLIGGSRLVMFDLDWNPATVTDAASYLAVPRCRGAFTPSTRVASRRGGRSDREMAWTRPRDPTIHTGQAGRRAVLARRAAVPVLYLQICVFRNVGGADAPAATLQGGPPERHRGQGPGA